MTPIMTEYDSITQVYVFVYKCINGKHRWDCFGLWACRCTLEYRSFLKAQCVADMVLRCQLIRSSVVAVALSLVFCTSYLARSEINKPISQSKSFPYIYAEVGNPGASYPVVEHLALSDRPDFDESVDLNGIEDRPEFLFSDTGTYRIVEFYVHW
jgi:hypothetical protein